MIIIMISMVALRFLGDSSVANIRATSNEELAREAQHAAEAALDFAIAWYAKNEPEWTNDGTKLVATLDDAVPQALTRTGDRYIEAVTFTRDLTARDFIRVNASVRSQNNSTIVAQNQQYIHDNHLLRAPDIVGPPLVVAGCFAEAKGNPKVYPENVGDIVVLTSSGSDCTDLGHLQLNGGVAALNAFDPDKLWDLTFSVSRQSLKEIAASEEAAGTADDERTVVWVYDDKNYHQSWGSADSPIILIFDEDADCPKINGSPEIFGIVFIDSECDSGSGWGGLTVTGTVAINGKLRKLNANTEIRAWGTASNDTNNLKSSRVARIPATWRDF
ncbi:MAG: hypothetical protein ABJK20_14835 [Halieaceae bacterium]